MIGVYVKNNLCVFGTVMIFIANPSADGQSLPPPQNVPSPPTYCKTSALNGPTFMKLIQRIVAHGDLTDIKYIEKTLDIRLPEEEGITPDGTPDPYSPFYRANYVDGSGIHVEIFTYGPNLTSQKGAFPYRATMSFENELTAPNFIGSCFKLSVHNFTTYFGGSFDEIWAAPGGIIGGTQVKRKLDKNKIYLTYSVEFSNTSVINGVGISQTP